jgi:hypothetical protein
MSTTFSATLSLHVLNINNDLVITFTQRHQVAEEDVFPFRADDRSIVDPNALHTGF